MDLRRKTNDFLRSFYKRLYDFNLFIPDHEWYEGVFDPHIDQNQQRKQQKYATWLFISLFIICSYNLTFMALRTPQTIIVTKKIMNTTDFDRLYEKYSETLSCPCTTINIPYQTIVSNEVQFHSICSSDFITRRWAESLYRKDRSQLFVTDFRKTAYAQFVLLADLCQISREVVANALDEINRYELMTIQLFQQEKIESQINATIVLVRNMAPATIISALELLRVMYGSNALVSALGTNAVVRSSAQDAAILSTFYWNKQYVNENVFHRGCLDETSIAPAGIYDLSAESDFLHWLFWPQNPYSQYELDPIVMIDGFFGGCFPFDALLASTLDCLYMNECLTRLDLYFPNLESIYLQSVNLLPSASRRNISVQDLISNLFIEQWITTFNYNAYFMECAPQLCTYITTDLTNLSYALTIFIGLYGGLTAILRFLALSSVYTVYNTKVRLVRIKINRANIRHWITKLREINLFQTPTRQTPNDLRNQSISTRCFLILFIGLMIVVLLINTLRNRTVTMIIHHPSSSTYHLLKSSYSESLECPCEQINTRHDDFMIVTPIFHEICSSDMISDAWIDLLTETRLFALAMEGWLNEASRYFRYLAALCQLAKRLIDNGLHQFLARSLVTINVLNEEEFQAKLNSTFIQFVESLLIGFRLFIETSNSVIQVDQPLNQFNRNPIIFKTNSSLEYTYRLNAISIENSTNASCLCALNASCQTSIPLITYIMRSTDTMVGVTLRTDFDQYVGHGLVKACYMIDTVRLSSLECFYNHSNCSQKVFDTLNASLNFFRQPVAQFDVRPLINNRDPLTRFTPETFLFTIINEMMIDRWNLSISFEQYYNQCRPNTCRYSYTKRDQYFLGMIISFVSTVGGLATSLRFLVPLIVNLLSRVLQHRESIRRSTSSENSTNRRTFRHRLEKIPRNFMNFLHVKILTLNIFPARHFPPHLNRQIVKTLGEWSTRIHIIFLITSFLVVGLHVIVRPEILTKTYSKPTFNFYTLISNEHDAMALKCPCSSISSSYNDFVTVEPIFHQICNSSFIVDEWRINLTQNLLNKINLYEITDYRRFFSAHLLFLNRLCQLSIQSVNYFVNQFLSSALVTNELLSRSAFQRQINFILRQNQMNAPSMLNRLFFLLRSTSHSNAIVSMYGTNFEYFQPSQIVLSNRLECRALTYGDHCSCDFNASCITNASYVSKNDNEIISLIGLKIGCTPSESLFMSTLECFYNASCINLLMLMIDDDHSSNIPSPLNIEKSRFTIETTILDLVNHLFIEQWLMVSNYSSYFHRCLPTSCSYTYRQQLDSFYTVTYLISILGGLTIIYRLICPRLVYFLVKFYRYYKRRQYSVAPSLSVIDTNHD